MPKLTFPIIEIFTSIQGEGCNLGKPANFVRFAGCNLNCPWCDTKWDDKGEELTSSEIIERLDHRVPFVVFTGGEPLLQQYLPVLIESMAQRDWDMAIETNGTKSTKYIKNCWSDIWITCSPKPQTNWEIHAQCIYDELKYVVDGQFGEQHIQQTNKPIWLQPEGNQMQKRWKESLEIQQRALTTNLDIRIGIQLHKIMEVK